MKSLYICIALTISMFSCKSTTEEQSSDGIRTKIAVESSDNQLSWLTIDDLDKIDPAEGKGILIDVFTDWCGWCKVMDKKTFSDPTVIDFLNKNYHVIKFNAEQKEPIQFKGKTYEWKKGGRKGYNELAQEMLDGRMSYPSIVYFDANKEKIIAVPGYKKPDQILSDIKRIEAF